MRIHNPSPYELALGPAIDRLHPRLRAYFTAPPAGSMGYGEGVFEVVGTPRRWLWPVLALLGSQGVLFSGWHANVPFVVVNAAGTHPGAHAVVRARRSFRFPKGEKTMVDAVTYANGRLTDYLGTRRQYAARLTAKVEDGRLVMSSTRLAVRVGRRYVWVPRWIAPRVTLTEEFVDAIERQRVTVRLAMPVIGQLYVYSGTFEYSVRRMDAEGREHG